VLVLDLVEDFKGRGKNFALSLVDSLDQFVSHVGESLIVRLSLNVDGIEGVINFIVEHVVMEGC
jgi:hypothetical protein